MAVTFDDLDHETTDLPQTTQVAVSESADAAKAHLLTSDEGVRTPCHAEARSQLKTTTLADTDREVCINCLRAHGDLTIVGGRTTDDVDEFVLLRGNSARVKHRLAADATREDPEPACTVHPSNGPDWRMASPRQSIFRDPCNYCFPGGEGSE